MLALVIFYVQEKMSVYVIHQVEKMKLGQSLQYDTLSVIRLMGRWMVLYNDTLTM